MTQLRRYPAPKRQIVTLAVCTLFLLFLAHGTFTHAEDAPRIGLNYGPFREGQAPDGAIPSLAELEEDIVAMAEKVEVIRLYSTGGLGEQIIALAQKHDLEVVAQAWIDRDLETNQREVQAVIDAANAYDNVVAVLVGSEVLLRGDVPASTLTGYIEQVQAGVDVPVGYADILVQWQTSRRLIATVDWVGLHSYGFWGCQEARTAASFTMFDWKAAVEHPQIGQKPIKLMETGWPGAGLNPNCPIAGRGDLESQAQFTRDILTSAQLAGLETFLFQYADEPWKCDERISNEATVGCHWGLVGVSRQPKPAWNLLPERGESLSAYTASISTTPAPCYARPNMSDDPLTVISPGAEVRVYGTHQRQAAWLVEHEKHICWVEGAALMVDPDFPPTTVIYFNE